MDKRIDNYITKSADFAKPILNHLRKLIHTACPHVEETIKWGFPHFDYKGMMCSMAAFKHHCAFNFWKAALMKDADSFEENNKNSMGHYGKIASLEDLPSDKIIISRIKEAMKLNDEGIKVPERNKPEKKEVVVPDSLQKELVKIKKQHLLLIISALHKKENILIGSAMQRQKRQKIKEFQLQLNGCQKVKYEIGNTSENSIIMLKYKNN